MVLPPHCTLGGRKALEKLKHSKSKPKAEGAPDVGEDLANKLSSTREDLADTNKLSWAIDQLERTWPTEVSTSKVSVTLTSSGRLNEIELNPNSTSTLNPNLVLATFVVQGRRPYLIFVASISSASVIFFD